MTLLVVALCGLLAAAGAASGLDPVIRNDYRLSAAQGLYGASAQAVSNSTGTGWGIVAGGEIPVNGDQSNVAVTARAVRFRHGIKQTEWASALSIPRSRLAAAASGNVVAFGGGGKFDDPLLYPPEGIVYGTVDFFDVTKDEWGSSASLLSVPRNLLAAAGSENRDIVVFAGGSKQSEGGPVPFICPSCVDSFKDTVDIINVTSRSLRGSTTLSLARDRLAGVRIAGSGFEFLVFAGGLVVPLPFTAGSESTLVEFFDTATLTMHAQSLSFSKGRGGCTVATVGKKALFLGGEDNDNPGSAELLDFSSGTSPSEFRLKTVSFTAAKGTFGRQSSAAVSVGNYVVILTDSVEFVNMETEVSFVGLADVNWVANAAMPLSQNDTAVVVGGVSAYDSYLVFTFPPEGNTTIIVDVGPCNINGFNETLFKEEAARNLDVDPSQIVILSVRCENFRLIVEFVVTNYEQPATGGLANSSTTWTIIAISGISSSTTSSSSVAASTTSGQLVQGTTTSSRSADFNGLIIAALIGALCLVVCVLVALLAVRRQRARTRTGPTDDSNMIELALLRNLSLESKIGSGNFGDVYKGTWTDTEGTRRLVAVKELRRSSATVGSAAHAELMHEATILSQTSHPNVVAYFGASSFAECDSTKVVVHPDDSSVLLVMELCEFGSLTDVLRGKVPDLAPQALTPADVAKIALQGATGMVYLHETLNLVHRDFALRNLLASRGHGADQVPFKVKVADLGLAKLLGSDYDSYYSTDSGKEVPIRWSAPEAILRGRYSEESDVYSFGVTLIELCTFGKVPFADLSNDEVIKRMRTKPDSPAQPLPFIEAAKPSPFKLPNGCPLPDSMWSLVLACCTYDSKQRPSFQKICLMLAEVIKDSSTDPAQYVDISDYPAVDTEFDSAAETPGTLYNTRSHVTTVTSDEFAVVEGFYQTPLGEDDEAYDRYC